MKKTLTLDTLDVRTLCVEHNLYTHGDCRAYEHMFDLCSKWDGGDSGLQRIATDIVDHSDMEELEDYGLESDDEMVAFVMTLLANHCITVAYTC